MKLNKKTVQQIENIIAQLDRGIAKIDAPDTRIVIVRKHVTAMPDSLWTNGLGETGLAITKDIGSELCYLRNARHALKQLITPIIVESDAALVD